MLNWSRFLLVSIHRAQFALLGAVAGEVPDSCSNTCRLKPRLLDLQGFFRENLLCRLALTKLRSRSVVCQAPVSRFHRGFSLRGTMVADPFGPGEGEGLKTLVMTPIEHRFNFCRPLRYRRAASKFRANLTRAFQFDNFAAAAILLQNSIGELSHGES